MKIIRICAVVTGKTIDEFLGNLEKIQRIADLVELRVDYVNGFSVGDVDLIRSKTKTQAIFTCRRKEEGGFFHGKERERMAILKKAMESGFDYIDIELSTAQILPTPFNKGGEGAAKIILSFHNLEKTSSLPELEEIKRQMKKYSPDVMKFATFVWDDADSKILFQFLLDKQADEEMIVIGMGERGKMVRVIAPLLGSYLTYASTDYSESAAGQIDIKELKKLYNEMRIVKLLNC